MSSEVCTLSPEEFPSDQPRDEFTQLVRQLADPRLIDCLLSGTEFHAMRKPARPESHSNQDVAEIAMSCALKTLSVVQVTIHSLRRHKLDRETGVQIGAIVSLAQHELSTLQSALPGVYR
jgi:hypothetical protein